MKSPLFRSYLSRLVAGFARTLDPLRPPNLRALPCRAPRLRFQSSATGLHLDIAASTSVRYSDAELQHPDPGSGAFASVDRYEAFDGLSPSCVSQDSQLAVWDRHWEQ